LMGEEGGGRRRKVRGHSNVGGRGEGHGVGDDDDRRSGKKAKFA